jgi:hypothetical protein
MTERIILPTEVKVCATCSYWDGERMVDPDVNVVVVADSCQGECLAQEKMVEGLHDTRRECSCIWESLEPDEVREDPAKRGSQGLAA